MFLVKNFFSEVIKVDESTARYDQAGEGDFNIEEEVEASTHISLKKITLLREILVTQMNNLALFPLAAAVFCIGWKYSSRIEYLWLIIGLVPIVFYLFRIKLNNFLVLMLAHLAIIVAVRFIFSNVGGMSFYVMACAVYAIYSIIVRMRSTDFQDGRLPMTVVAGIAAAALFFLRYVWTDGSFEMQITITFIISFGLSLLVTYMESYINFLIVNRSSTGHIPAREIFLSGSFMAVVCVLLMMLLLLFTSGIGWLQVILKGIGGVVSAVLRVIFSMIGPDERGIFVDDTHIDGGAMPQIQEMEEPALIWRILTVAAMITLAIAAVYLFFRIVKSLYSFIRERMEYKGLASDNKDLGSIKDVREKCSISEKDGRNDKFLFKNMINRFSPEEKIRRLYKKHVLKCGDIIPQTDDKKLSGPDLHKPELMTAGEWGKVLNKPDMSKIYDKARYSGTECTSEDYKLMKQALNN